MSDQNNSGIEETQAFLDSIRERIQRATSGEVDRDEDSLFTILKDLKDHEYTRGKTAGEIISLMQAFRRGAVATVSEVGLVSFEEGMERLESIMEETRIREAEQGLPGLKTELSAVRREIEKHSLGDRPPAPPADLMRRELELMRLVHEAEALVAKGKRGIEAKLRERAAATSPTNATDGAPEMAPNAELDIRAADLIREQKLELEQVRRALYEKSMAFSEYVGESASADVVDALENGCEQAEATLEDLLRSGGLGEWGSKEVEAALQEVRGALARAKGARPSTLKPVEVIRTKVDRLKEEHPDLKLSFGYIGNLETGGRDDRSWYVFTGIRGLSGRDTDRWKWGGYETDALAEMATEIEGERFDRWLSDAELIARDPEAYRRLAAERAQQRREDKLKRPGSENARRGRSL